MRKSAMTLAAITALTLAGPAVAELNAEQVVDRYVEARGGREAWSAIESMKVTGEYTAFSMIQPFTLHRTRDDLYHMDHLLGEKLVVIGYDGRKAWWDNHWYGAGAREVTGADLAVVMREVEFLPPLFVYADRGWTLELIGETDVEGIPAIGLELTRDDESKETWYLDPDSYLEVARDSPGSDFGRPMEQRTWYDDFRQVSGVTIPFFTETQWYTRDRVMRVTDVEIDVEVDQAMFRMPAPPGMGPLQTLEGNWTVAIESRQRPDAEFESSEMTSTITSALRGALLEEEFTTKDGNAVVRTFSYDKFRETYRMTAINDVTTHLDVLQGDFADSGRLTVTNVDTGTPTEMFGMTIHDRVSIFDITDDGFLIEHEVSIDGGENWWIAEKSSYARQAE